MALDEKAGKRKPVGIVRNLMPALNEAAIDSANTSTVAEKLNIETPSYTRSAESKAVEIETFNRGTGAISAKTASAPKSEPVITAKNLNRTKKISFLADPALEKEFRQMRLKAGYEKLEDAYSAALKLFCDQVKKGNLQNNEF